MTSPKLSQNQTPTDVSLSDLLNIFKREILTELNCHAWGTIQSFNKVNQTAQVSINYKKTFFDDKGNPIYIDYPLLLDCPCIILGGGQASLQMPISKGDECLIFFNDRDIDNWFESGQVGPVASSRLHSISDGIALVGLRSSPNVLTGYDGARAALVNGEAKIAVGTSLIEISNSTRNLNTLLQNLISQVKDLVSACAAITVTGVSSGGSLSGPPQNASTISAISTQLTTTATQIGELLE